MTEPEKHEAPKDETEILETYPEITSNEEDASGAEQSSELETDDAAIDPSDENAAQAVETESDIAVSEGVEPASPRKSSPLPLVLGGVIAGAIGFGAGYYTHLTYAPMPEMVAAPEPVDLSPLEARLSALETAPAAPLEIIEQLSKTQAEVVASLTALREELRALPAQSAAQPTLDNTALAQLTARVEAAEMLLANGVASAETEALNAARAAEQRTAQQALVMALETGASFEQAASLLDPALPQELMDMAEDGIPTASDLNDAFPALARSALAQSRAQAAGEGSATARVMTFIAAQVGARSVAPREGTTVDAILSRAGAAARADDLGVALRELQTLPEAARAPFSDWIMSAEQREAAKSAIASYINSNQG